MFRALANGLKVIFDTTEIYEGVSEYDLEEARLDYSRACLILAETNEYILAIQILDRAIKRVPTFIDAYYLREDAWHKHLKETKGTQKQTYVYRSYCQSAAWRIKRTAVLKRDNHKCVLCNKEAVHVHHSNYENIGKELLSDLVSLCIGCHTDFHSKHTYENHDYGYAKVVSMFLPD